MGDPERVPQTPPADRLAVPLWTRDKRRPECALRELAPRAPGTRWREDVEGDFFPALEQGVTWWFEFTIWRGSSLRPSPGFRRVERTAGRRGAPRRASPHRAGP